MKTKSKVLSRVIAIALALVVGCGMLITPATVEAATVAKPAQVQLTSVARYDYNAIKIKWKKANNAVKYQVYRATSQKGTYKKIATTTATSYVNKSLTTGKTYYYKVRGINSKNYVGKFSTVKSSKPYLSKGKLIITDRDEYGNKSFTFKVGKVNGATGYQIYRSTKKSSGYTKVKSVKSGTTKVKITGYKADTKYYHKVRAYRKVGNGYVYGAFSGLVVFETDSHRHYYKEVYKDGKLVEYKCPCGDVKKVSHTHKWISVIVRGDFGYYGGVSRYVTKSYCQTCDKIIAETPANHLESTHAGDKYAVCGRYTVQASHNEWKSSMSNGMVVGDECEVCHKYKNNHIHNWKAVYADGYYEEMCFPYYNFYCNLCKSYSDPNNCIDAHLMDGQTPTYTKKKTGSIAAVKVWIDSKIIMGYKCSCGQTMGNVK